LRNFWETKKKHFLGNALFPKYFITLLKVSTLCTSATINIKQLFFFAKSFFSMLKNSKNEKMGITLKKD